MQTSSNRDIGAGNGTLVRAAGQWRADCCGHYQSNREVTPNAAVTLTISLQFNTVERDLRCPCYDDVNHRTDPSFAETLLPFLPIEEHKIIILNLIQTPGTML